jgi:pullulanase-type alpha-1,6-glucosidase
MHGVLKLLMLVLLLCLASGQPASAAPAHLPAAANAAPIEARAHWLARDLVAWNAPVSGPVVMLTDAGNATTAPTRAAASFSLEPAGTVSGSLAKTVPHLKGMRLYRIKGPTRNRVGAALRGRVTVAVRKPDGELVARTGLQIGGVLDDLYRNDAPLGVSFARKRPSIRLWAPTARSVRLTLYDRPSGGEATVLPMTRDPATGVWRITGAADWNRKHYIFEVTVFAPSVGRVTTNFVTDPYSLNLSANGERSQIINLDDADLQPEGWNRLARSLPEAPEDSAIYELHVRDFSISDATATRVHRGKYLAFTDLQSNGMRHLRALGEAGLTHLHLLPTFDCATVPERAAEHRTTPDLSGLGPASGDQQAAVEKIRAEDAFNWCYDPLHFFAPDGNYATDPDGPARVLEFRKMVLGLDRVGLGTVLDVVFNHTAASGQTRLSVLDRHRARLLSPPRREGRGRDQHLLCQYRHRASNDGKAHGRRAARLGARLQGQRLSLRSDGASQPREHPQSPRAAEGTDAREASRRWRQPPSLWRRVELRGSCERRALRPGDAAPHG